MLGGAAGEAQCSWLLAGTEQRVGLFCWWVDLCLYLEGDEGEAAGGRMGGRGGAMQLAFGGH